MQPSIIFMDELDSLVSKDNARSTTFGIENYIAAELRTIANHRILCIAATSRLNEIPQKLLGFRGFHRQINLPVPTGKSRKQILRSLVPETRLSNHVVEIIADRTPAYVGSDLTDLVFQSSAFCNKRLEHLGVLNKADAMYTVLEEDIDKALHLVRPSAMRDAVLEPPKVRWEEIGGQEEVKKVLRSVCERQVCHSQYSLFQLLPYYPIYYCLKKISNTPSRIQNFRPASAVPQPKASSSMVHRAVPKLSQHKPWRPKPPSISSPSKAQNFLTCTSANPSAKSERYSKKPAPPHLP